MGRLPVFVLAWLIVLLAAAATLALRGGGVRRADPRRYKPRASHRSSETRFDDAPAASADTSADASTADADADAPLDFVTGAALSPDVAIVRCEDCRACYHPETVAILAEHNAGGCASCGGTTLRPLARGRPRRAADARAADRHGALVVEPTSPDGYAAALGRLVSVNAHVLRALPAARGAVPALLLRDDAGTELRLAFVGDAFRGPRGRAFATGLLGARIRVRGVLLRDEAHGWRLLAIDPAMVRELVA